jgi:hypothetical protein
MLIIPESNLHRSFSACDISTLVDSGVSGAEESHIRHLDVHSCGVFVEIQYFKSDTKHTADRCLIEVLLNHRLFWTNSDR